MTFDARVVIELVQEIRDPVDVLQEYGYVDRNAFNLVASAVFQTELHRCIEESSQGLSFRARARIMATDVLETAYNIALDKEASDAVRLDAGKWIARMGDLEPKEKKSDTNTAFVLNINM